MECIKCDHWNQTGNFCGDPTLWVDPETDDRVCRFKPNAVHKYSVEYFESIKPKLRKVQQELNYLELDCDLPDICVDKVHRCIKEISGIIANISDLKTELEA